MKIVREFPNPVRSIENVWIPLADGCRLAARLWLPSDAETHPVPAIVEYIPYRKRDGTRERDEPMHHYFAGHGYAAVRVDLRGSGESDGLLLDEYLEREQLDGVEVIRWVASQSWCDGAVGMMGKSWGGFNALQVAALAPPELRAILTVCSTDDRYADDAHYMGGCLLNENLIWGATLFTLNAQPPDPALVGDRWRSMWRDRLEHATVFPARWLRHPHRDDYWSHGSVCEDFSKIRCPVYAVGGWADGYSNAVPRLLAGLEVPRRGLVGPWAHVYPHDGVPGPAIGFLQEALRWWDRWLRGVENGIENEPAYRVWMQESVSPHSFYDERPGRWVAEEGWPSARIEHRRFALNSGTLDDRAAPSTRLSICSPQTVGLAAGAWCGFGIEGEAPLDQREDDMGSLVFDSAPLSEPIEMLGAAAVELDVDVDQRVAVVAIRLNDVAPDGASTRVSYGLANLGHYAGSGTHAAPVELPRGEPFRVRIELNDAAHVFPAGHRLRLAVSTAYWPVAWPAPRPVTLGLHSGASTLVLPLRPPRAEDEALAPFPRPEAAPPIRQTDLHPGGASRTVERVAGATVLTSTLDADERGGPAMSRVEAIDLEVGHCAIERFAIGDDDPLSARGEVVQRTASRRAGWSVAVETRIELRASEGEFEIRAELEARESDAVVHRRDWKLRVERKLV